MKAAKIANLIRQQIPKITSQIFSTLQYAKSGEKIALIAAEAKPRFSLILLKVNKSNMHELWPDMAKGLPWYNQ